MSPEQRADLRAACETAIAASLGRSCPPVVPMLPVSMVVSLLDYADDFDELLAASLDLMQIIAALLNLMGRTDPGAAGGTFPAADYSSLNPNSAGADLTGRARHLFGLGTEA